MNGMGNSFPKQKTDIYTKTTLANDSLWRVTVTLLLASIDLDKIMLGRTSGLQVTGPVGLRSRNLV